MVRVILNEVLLAANHSKTDNSQSKWELNPVRPKLVRPSRIVFSFKFTKPSRSHSLLVRLNLGLTCYSASSVIDKS